MERPCADFACADFACADFACADFACATFGSGQYCAYTGQANSLWAQAAQKMIEFAGLPLNHLIIESLIDHCTGHLCTTLDH